MRRFVSAKIHGVRVTDKSVEYHGSVSISRELMREAGILPFEEVQVVNLTNGARWTTYALPADDGFSLNGGGARMGELGDKCVLLTYRTEKEFSGADVIFCDQDNSVVDRLRYENS